MSAINKRICAGLFWIAEEKGYSPGWVRNAYRERLGDWPPDEYADLEPQEPSKALREFVRLKAKRFAKAKAKSERREELRNGAPRKPASQLASVFSHMRAIRQEGT